MDGMLPAGRLPAKDTQKKGCRIKTFGFSTTLQKKTSSNMTQRQSTHVIYNCDKKILSCYIFICNSNLSAAFAFYQNHVTE